MDPLRAVAANARRIVFFTGAGMSAESGVPTYRGRGGIWSSYDYTEYACQEAFDRDPAKVWSFHDLRRERVAACAPHRGHAIVAAVEAARPGTAVVTQNIDGMHQRAGSREVFELHGSLWRARCEACGATDHHPFAPIPSHRCGCGAWWRPAIVWFGDALDERVLGAAIARIAACDLLVSIGTSAVVYPAADLPRHARGAVTVEINPEETPMSHLYDHRLRGAASQQLAALFPGGVG